jgi:GNAT superfamily N-acetyltransferase
MDVTYSRMREGQEGQVTDLILALIADYGTTFKSVLTPQSLRQSTDFLNVEVAEYDGKIVGICAWVMSFSTWRGTKGMYVADHFVTKAFRHSDVARKLLHLAATNGAQQGAAFIRVEVDITDDMSEELYTDVGFWNQTRHMLYFLEPGEFDKFVTTTPMEVA